MGKPTKSARDQIIIAPTVCSACYSCWITFLIDAVCNQILLLAFLKYPHNYSPFTLRMHWSVLQPHFSITYLSVNLVYAHMQYSHKAENKGTVTPQ